MQTISDLIVKFRWFILLTIFIITIFFSYQFKFLEVDSNIIDEITLTGDKPWTMLSFQLYGTIELWWVVYLLNKPDYIFKAKANTPYKFIKSDFMSNVLQQITQSQ